MTSINQEILRTWFDYSSEGLLIWKKGKKRINVGDVFGANSYGSDGYRYCFFEGKRYKNSRLIFMWHFGYFPKEIDHINRDILDDRIENLRAATPSQNQGNTLLIRKSNSSGYRGVSYDKSRNSWQASIHQKGIKIHLGRFKDIIEAARAYDMAAIKYFGEFATLNFSETNL